MNPKLLPPPPGSQLNIDVFAEIKPGRLDTWPAKHSQGTELVCQFAVGPHDRTTDELIRPLMRWVARHGGPEDMTAAKRCFDHLMRRSFPRYLILQKLSPWLEDFAG